ncbi:type III polyketide synthase [Hufsiella ginkgonis]|uniref:Type III polyketide synthase n=1 Tax=Hufsiella ginkgonis TaxID=2695274 RepID=A0A7K1XY05_9SPHI|nr:type III polyketide synthase [Hufsiella ginkgonis]MXV15717.1 type III polyketide synthase [Hufsiella ginkgonis]
MPFIAAVSTIDFPDRTDQEAVKKQARELFIGNFPQIDRLLAAFDSTEIKTRNFCKPLSYYAANNTFGERNDHYIELSLRYAIEAITHCLDRAGTAKEDITDILFVSTTGLATPSMDALIINAMRLDPGISRTPVWGLGCAGGVSGMAKANIAAKANPDAVVLLVSVELCSLTLIKNDYSKSNFIGSSLFSDGIAACIIKGDNHAPKQDWFTEAGKQVFIIDSGSKLYYDSLDVMGWDFRDTGFKVLFSKDIPTLIHQHVRQDITGFLARHNLTLEDIRSFVFHPGGKKVLDAYVDALEIDRDNLAAPPV